MIGSPTQSSKSLIPPILNLEHCYHIIKGFAARLHPKSVIAGYTLTDVECVVASLIDQGYMKGYIHPTKRLAVLSKSDPFPKVRDVTVYTHEWREEDN